MTRAERIAKAAPTMAAVYERTFRVPLRERIADLLTQYPNVSSPDWISWEGHRITNAATSDRLAELLEAITPR